MALNCLLLKAIPLTTPRSSVVTSVQIGFEVFCILAIWPCSCRFGLLLLSDVAKSHNRSPKYGAPRSEADTSLPFLYPLACHGFLFSKAEQKRSNRLSNAKTISTITNETNTPGKITTTNNQRLIYSPLQTIKNKSLITCLTPARRGVA